MFMILNIILIIVIFNIERSKDPEFGKVSHLILAPLVVISSIPGSIGLIIYLVLSNTKSIGKGLNTKLSDIKGNNK